MITSFTSNVVVDTMTITRRLSFTSNVVVDTMTITRRLMKMVTRICRL